MIEEYSTKNLQLSAYIYSEGLQFIRTYKVGKDVYFVFTPKEKAEELVNNYFQGKATCNPQQLFARLNDLKDLIFATK